MLPSPPSLNFNFERKFLRVLFMLMRIRVGNLEDYRKDKRIIYWLTRGISEYGIYYSWATDKVNR